MALLFPGLVLSSDWRPTRRYHATSGNEVMFISKNMPSKNRGGRPSSVARTNGSRKQYSAQVSETDLVALMPQMRGCGVTYRTNSHMYTLQQPLET